MTSPTPTPFIVNILFVILHIAFVESELLQLNAPSLFVDIVISLFSPYTIFPLFSLKFNNTDSF